MGRGMSQGPLRATQATGPGKQHSCTLYTEASEVLCVWGGPVGDLRALQQTVLAKGLMADALGSLVMLSSASEGKAAVHRMDRGRAWTVVGTDGGRDGGWTGRTVDGTDDGRDGRWMGRTVVGTDGGWDGQWSGRTVDGTDGGWDGRWSGMALFQ